MQKPRVAIYYHNNFGRNDGPPLYYLHSLQNDFNVEVMHLFPEGDTSKFGKFDLHFWVDYGEDGLPVDHEWQIPKDGGKTIYVCSDAHIDQTGKNYRFDRAKRFKYAFFNQQRALQEFLAQRKEKLGAFNYARKELTTTWLPHAASPVAYPKTEQLKKFDVCFIGHFQDVKNYNGFTRIDALDRLFKEFPNFYFGTRNPQDPSINMFEDAAKKFSQSKIVFNVSIGDDINMRVFEALASGSMLLTNWIPTLGELFEDGKHLVTYKTLDEMVEKAKYYLEHDEEREAIALAGYEEFLAKHTYQKRIETIFKTLGYNTKDLLISKNK